MSPEPTGVHGLLKQRKLFTHKHTCSLYKIPPSDKRLYISAYSERGIFTILISDMCYQSSFSGTA